MNILILEPFYTGSHKNWLDGLLQYSKHNIKALTLPGRHWKWRMHGGAISLAEQFLKLDFEPDLILATDMLDLTSFLALTRKKTANIPTAIYFHENQFSYPWSKRDPDIVHNRDKHYGFINYTSALAADACFFNSRYHLKSFIEELHKFKKQAPDSFETSTIAQIESKSKVLYLGLELEHFKKFKTAKQNDKPCILWNHRWEYDKNANEFFSALKVMQQKEIEFGLAVLGESYDEIPSEFQSIKKDFKQELLHFGYLESFEDYARLLWQADLLPVTSRQDFFGASIVEAIACDTYPLLPNRLSYPELLPDKEYQDNFYQDYDELIKKLEIRLTSDSLKQKNFSQSVARFDWKSLIRQYDQELESIYNLFRHLS